MSTLWLLAACAVAYLLKLSGYLVPAHVLEHPRVLRMASVMTIGLLASLIVVNTISTGPALVADARVAALGAAVLALVLRAPFLVVVIVGAAAAALARLLVG